VIRFPRVRYRLSTLILLVVICAQITTMVIHQEEMSHRLENTTYRLNERSSQASTANKWLAERLETLKELKQLRAQVTQHDAELRRAWEGKGMPPGAIPEGVYSQLFADLQTSLREQERLARELQLLEAELEKSRQHTPASH
jgi:predicted  nucleic acid-binding Zn-ribbon protein